MSRDVRATTSVVLSNIILCGHLQIYLFSFALFSTFYTLHLSLGRVTVLKVLNRSNSMLSFSTTIKIHEIRFFSRKRSKSIKIRVAFWKNDQNLWKSGLSLSKTINFRDGLFEHNIFVSFELLSILKIYYIKVPCLMYLKWKQCWFSLLITLTFLLYKFIHKITKEAE